MNPILPDDLAVFLQTVQCGSFSAAARALNVAPKVASKQVARLEAALGVALFTRNTRNLRLTDEGEALRDKARSVLDGLAEMRELAQGADGMRGMIRLTAPAPFGRKYVAAAVADFSRRYPQVGFSLCLSDEVCNLFAGNFDLAIRMGELADSRLIARRIAVNRRIFGGVSGVFGGVRLSAVARRAERTPLFAFCLSGAYCRQLDAAKRRRGSGGAGKPAFEQR